MFNKANRFSSVQISYIPFISGNIIVPPSKSTSIRALLSAALAQGTSNIVNCSHSDNVNALISCCKLFGVSFFEQKETIIVNGVNPLSVSQPLKFNPGNSGAVLRFLMGTASIFPKTFFYTDYVKSLGKRTNSEFFEALNNLGVKISCKNNNSCLPFTLFGKHNLAKYTEISCRISSQYLSGLLYAGALSTNALHIKVRDKISSPSMVKTTIRILRQSNINIEVDKYFSNFFVPQKTLICPGTFIVGSDPASSAALLCIAASACSDIYLHEFFEEELGNGSVIEYIRSMGTHIDSLSNNTLHIIGSRSLRASDFDGSLAPDAIPALAALAAFAEGKSTFYNIEHIRYKESNRITDLRNEFTKLGIYSEETIDSLTVHGKHGLLKGNAIVDCHFDHALVMALTIIGINCKAPITIRNPEFVGQTYPNFFKDLSSITGSSFEYQMSE